LSSIRNGKTAADGKATEIFELPEYSDVGIITGTLFHHSI
jgi:hypothetical protein